MSRRRRRSTAEEQERRELRVKQRKLNGVLETVATEGASTNLEELMVLREKNNELFSGVSRTREAHLDMQNVKRLAEAIAKKVDGLNAGIVQFDTATFVSALRGVVQDADGVADWAALGSAAQRLNLGVPRLTFVNGALEKEAKTRKQRQAQRRRESVGPAVASRQLKLSAEDQQEESTAVRISALAETMRSREAAEGERGFLELVVNPESFTQTVENIFDYAFLVKDGKASVEVGERGVPEGVLLLEQNRDQELDAAMRGGASGQKVQNIVSLNLDAFRKIKSAFAITEPKVPTRPPPAMTLDAMLAKGNEEAPAAVNVDADDEVDFEQA